MKKSNKKPTLVDLLNDTEKLLQYVNDLNNIDLKNIVEMTDATVLQDQAACAGGACDIV